MQSKKLLVTGSSGLVGSEVCTYFAAKGWEIHGVDNNQRAVFFGPQADTRWNQKRLLNDLKHFFHHELDIRNRGGIKALIKELRPHAIIHAAAQPSHDKAAQIPFDDFETNAVGTLNILQAAKEFAPESPFVYFSTNKVYGDAPNHIALKELPTRWEFADPLFQHGISETLTIDQSKHSLFGASKVAADIMVQEYGRYFDMPTTCLRGGCLTGPNHCGVELHGFLSYLVKCNLESKVYTIHGYKGKQLRDNIHSLDIARFIDAYIQSPRKAEVYNLGGGKENTCSLLEAFSLVEDITGIRQQTMYSDIARSGDHICYYSDLSKLKAHYPQWDISVNLKYTLRQIVNSWQLRLN
jgi:CDP-paratose 2-epimerase